MNVILDLVGSFIVAGLLLLMLTSVNSNVSQFSVENGLAVSVQENLVELASEIEYDFRKIGFRVSNPSSAIISCDSTSIAFRCDIDNNQTVDTVRYSLGATSALTATKNPRDRQLIRRVNGTQIASSLGLTDFKLRFYNTSDAQTWTPSAVKGVEITLQVESPFPVDTTYARSSWKCRIYPRNL